MVHNSRPFYPPTALVEIKHYQQQLANPPRGWFTYGTYGADRDDLEYWGRDLNGFPIWERVDKNYRYIPE